MESFSPDFDADLLIVTRPLTETPEPSASPLLPGGLLLLSSCQRADARPFILHRVTVAFRRDSQLPKGIERLQTAMGIEGDDVREDAAVAEGFRGLAEGVDKLVVPASLRGDLSERLLEVGVGLSQPLLHTRRCPICRRMGFDFALVPPQHGGGPDFLRIDDIFEQRAECLAGLLEGDRFGSAAERPVELLIVESYGIVQQLAGVPGFSTSESFVEGHSRLFSFRQAGFVEVNTVGRRELNASGADATEVAG